MRSGVVVQLHQGEATIGQLIVVSRTPDAFTQDDVDTLKRLSTALSSAISHATEFESNLQQVEALARFETIYEGAAIGITLVSPAGAVPRREPCLRTDVRLQRRGASIRGPAERQASGRARDER